MLGPQSSRQTGYDADIGSFFKSDPCGALRGKTACTSEEYSDGSFSNLFTIGVIPLISGHALKITHFSPGSEFVFERECDQYFHLGSIYSCAT